MKTESERARARYLAGIASLNAACNDFSVALEDAKRADLMLTAARRRLGDAREKMNVLRWADQKLSGDKK